MFNRPGVAGAILQSPSFHLQRDDIFLSSLQLRLLDASESLLPDCITMTSCCSRFAVLPLVPPSPLHRHLLHPADSGHTLPGTAYAGRALACSVSRVITDVSSVSSDVNSASRDVLHPADSGHTLPWTAYAGKALASISRFIWPCKSWTNARFGITQFVTPNTHITRHPGVLSTKKIEKTVLVMWSQTFGKMAQIVCKIT